jgi:hypothetical protein
MDPSDLARFWSRVDKAGPEPEGDTLAAGLGRCWIWTGTPTPKGYGQMTVAGANVETHRLSCRIAGRRLRKDRVVDHLCRRPLCCNPTHLEQVTREENLRRGSPNGSAINATKTHCPHAHPYDEANTFTYRGRRYCRACNAERARARRAAVAPPREGPSIGERRGGSGGGGTCNGGEDHAARRAARST